jgi:hypothetical protein
LPLAGVEPDAGCQSPAGGGLTGPSDGEEGELPPPQPANVNMKTNERIEHNSLALSRLGLLKFIFMVLLGS